MSDISPANPAEGGPARSAAVKAGPPSDAQIDKARADKARAENAQKARDALAAKRAAEKPAEKSERPETETAKGSQGLEDGARLLVRFLWVLSAGAARLSGGRLESLTDEEVAQGAREALPLLGRVRWLAWLLGWVGFPFWLVRTIGAKFRREPKPPKAS